jgi:hypothetical protein
MDKKTISEFLQKSKVITIPDGFTGKVTLEINYAQGGVSSVERSVKELLR